ncbi:hypothetical protein E3N88_36972 [Mikania micrantha]|uniref:Uncharacterized protein n=1 Tax=Mikania micrantha TaxID=192012 RepID=A0A5N6M5Q5_9ASTR|nr:hypothetical protein E3N88_36972 [Mikania micrantha]
MQCGTGKRVNDLGTIEQARMSLCRVADLPWGQGGPTAGGGDLIVGLRVVNNFKAVWYCDANKKMCIKWVSGGKRLIQHGCAFEVKLETVVDETLVTSLEPTRTTKVRLDAHENQIQQLQADVTEIKATLHSLEEERAESAEFCKVVLAWMKNQEKKSVDGSFGSGSSSNLFSNSGPTVDPPPGIPWAVQKIK